MFEYLCRLRNEARRSWYLTIQSIIFAISVCSDVRERDAVILGYHTPEDHDGGRVAMWVVDNAYETHMTNRKQLPLLSILNVASRMAITTLRN